MSSLATLTYLFLGTFFNYSSFNIFRKKSYHCTRRFRRSTFCHRFSIIYFMPQIHHLLFLGPVFLQLILLSSVTADSHCVVLLPCVYKINAE